MHAKPTTSTPIPVPATLTGRALEEWNRVAPLLESQGRLTALNTSPFELYCRFLGMLDCVLLDAEQTTDRKLRADLLRRADALAGRVRELAKDYGLNPRGAKSLGDFVGGDNGVIDLSHLPG